MHHGGRARPPHRRRFPPRDLLVLLSAFSTLSVVFTFFVLTAFFFATAAGDATAGQSSSPDRHTGTKQDTSSRRAVGSCHIRPIERLATNAGPGERKGVYPGTRTSVVDLDRLYEWQHVVGGLFGLVLTLVVAPPGARSVGLGPLAIDPFYVVAGCFAVVCCWSTVALWQSRGDE